ncbi:MAG: hypothetical protein IKQ56_07260 [Lachnospiraceae bacterium]|nr:hypothetical protein [Lachnospiraceae bacterium]
MKRSVGTIGFILLLGCLLTAGCSRGEASSPAVDSAGGNGDGSAAAEGAAVEAEPEVAESEVAESGEEAGTGESESAEAKQEEAKPEDAGSDDAVKVDPEGGDLEKDKALGQNSGERPAVVYSYDETVFLINGKRFDASRDFEVGCNAIMDMFEVGDWVVVEGHINPHVGGYYFYNIFTEKVEKMITGANLTWKGDDITTAVYSCYTDLYNFKDNLLGSMDNEICELKFDPKEDLVYAEDFEGNKQVFEIGPGDPAMYRYADYLRNKNEDTWNAFIKEAPEGAVAYVMINPPVEVEELFSYPDPRETEYDESVHVVALQDDTEVSLDLGTFDLDAFKFVPEKNMESCRLKRGEGVGYAMVVPEGIPNVCISASNKTGAGQFPVSVLSGQFDICGKFITASGE